MIKQNPVSTHKCEECNICCIVFDISEIKHRAGNLCSKWCQSIRCTIYDERPYDCRKFECLWLETQSMPDSWRPDKSNVIMREAEAYGCRIVSFWETKIDALKNRDIMAFIKTTLEKGTIVVLRRKDPAGQYPYYWSPVFPSKDFDLVKAQLLMPILKRI